MSDTRCLLAIDPGTHKCGVAVVCCQKTGPFAIRYRAIVPTVELVAIIPALLVEYDPQAGVIGAATMGKRLFHQLLPTLPEHWSLILVPEAHTSEEARRRYWQENPPSGFVRFLPVGLRIPPEPYDDWAAVILAERFLASQELA